MTSVTSRHENTESVLSRRRSRNGRRVQRGNAAGIKCAIFVAALSLAALAPLVPRALAQSSTPHITAVDPPSGKVGDTVTLTGTNLGKGAVAAVFLSDDKTDYKATLVDQAAEKLVIKIPQVKAGGYNLSVQIGGQILILPAHFTVE
jgi:hypothetical protein